MTLTIDQLENLAGNSFLLGLFFGGIVAFYFWHKYEALKDEVMLDRICGKRG